MITHTLKDKLDTVVSDRSVAGLYEIPKREIERNTYEC
jgi:hypothetical protein